MLDIKFVRANPDAVKENIKKKFQDEKLVLVDEVLDIHQRDAENTMRELAVREGIFCGVSSGGAVAGALRVAKANPGAVVVAIICDRGDRYLSTGVFGEEHFSQGAGI